MLYDYGIKPYLQLHDIIETAGSDKSRNSDVEKILSDGDEKNSGDDPFLNEICSLKDELNDDESVLRSSDEAIHGRIDLKVWSIISLKVYFNEPCVLPTVELLI